MLSFSVVKSAGSAGNYYTDKDNYYVLGSMGERWAGQGAEQLGKVAVHGALSFSVSWRLHQTGAAAGPIVAPEPESHQYDFSNTAIAPAL